MTITSQITWLPKERITINEQISNRNILTKFSAISQKFSWGGVCRMNKNLNQESPCPGRKSNRDLFVVAASRDLTTYDTRRTSTQKSSRLRAMPWWFRGCMEVKSTWNVMAHAQKPDFVFRRNGRVHFNRRWLQFSRLLAAEVCASGLLLVVMLDTPRSEVVRRVMATHSIRQFHLHFPSRASPCAITFQMESNTPSTLNIATTPKWLALRQSPLFSPIPTVIYSSRTKAGPKFVAKNINPLLPQTSDV